MRGKITFLVFSLNLLTLSACQQAREMHEMHDTTAEMRDITKEMRDNTKQMNVATKAMNGNMGAMQQSLADTLNDMHQMVSLMTQLIGNTGEMNKTTLTMSNSLQDMKKSMDDMHLDTKTLATQMDKLSKVTETNLIRTNTTMNRMAKTTDGLCQSRHAVTADRRDHAMNRIRIADSPEKKVAGASEYMMSFEFQQWGLCGDDTPETRDQMLATAMNEFAFDLAEFTNSNEQANPLSSLIPVLKSARQDDNFNAVAAALHMVDDLQMQTLPKFNAAHKTAIPQVSMLSLIAEALAMPKPLKEWQMVVRSHRPLMIRLLQARHNFTTGVVMNDLVKAAKAQSTYASIATFFNVILTTRASYNVNIDGFTVDELKRYTQYLGFALETRQILAQKLGEPLYRDASLNGLVQGVKVNSTKVASRDVQATRARFQGFMNLIKK